MEGHVHCEYSLAMANRAARKASMFDGRTTIFNTYGLHHLKYPVWTEAKP